CGLFDAYEYLVGSEIEEKHPNLSVWVPSKDTGIDLLITSTDFKKPISLQVKFSKDFLGKSVRDVISKGVKSGGWWTFKREKIETSPADYWVLVLYQFQHRAYDFIIIKPSKLLSIYDALKRGKGTIQSYVWVTSNKSAICWETRGLNKLDQEKIAIGAYRNRLRNLTPYLNDWKAIEKLDKNT
ncbi:MAG: hypothetical protein KAS04_02370, partial [Candidatus Aenigmarchaeota archaeon]|nr:hypothetical protein [Candidatus Aenigmarchaeota archaeon]